MQRFRNAGHHYSQRSNLRTKQIKKKNCLMTKSQKKESKLREIDILTVMDRIFDILLSVMDEMTRQKINK